MPSYHLKVKIYWSTIKRISMWIHPEDKASPIVMDKLVPHAIEVSWLWTTLTANTEDEPSDEEEEPDELTDAEDACKNLLEQYKDDVDLEDKASPIVMDKLIPHAIEVLWLRKTLVANTEDEPSDEEEDPDEFTRRCMDRGRRI
ncbi:unnamed protein product [Caenorhabditis brenneri]